MDNTNMDMRIGFSGSLVTIRHIRPSFGVYYGIQFYTYKICVLKRRFKNKEFWAIEIVIQQKLKQAHI